MMARRDRWILAVTALCAAGVPLTAAAWVSARTGALAAHLGAAAGVPAQIGAIDADLTGTIRLSRLALGQLVAAESLEASVALGSLLAGTLRADEIRVAGPRVAVQVDGNGDSDLGRVARRLASHGRSASGGSGGRLRRIVVSSGTLSAQIAGLGALAAERVELVPDAGGVRVITGPVRLAGRNGPLAVDLAFGRSAAELALPHLRVGRVLAVGGAGDLAISAAPAETRRVAVRDLAIGRLGDGGALELRAAVDDGGVARPLAIDVARRDAQPDLAIDSPQRFALLRGPAEPDLAIAIRGDRIPLGALAGLAPSGVDVSRAHATGSLAVRRDAARTVVEIDGAIDGAALDHRILAATPVPLAAAVRGALAISPDAVALPGATVELGAARWTASGWLRRGAPTAGQLDLALATAPCSELLASLPGELRGPLDGIVLTGAFGGRVRLAVDLAAPAGDGVSLTTSITDGCRTEAEPPAADVGRLAGPSEQVFPDGSRARVGKGERGWTALRQLPGFVSRAFVSAEDARFYDHAGFDLVQIGKSLEIDLREHRLARGGSTISQQLIKNAFLSQRRSFDRKLQEAILTWRLESRLTKQQILERYLNIIELGPRIFGITAAARHWFDLAPHELTLRQAAFLAALTSEPTSMSRRVRRAGGLDLESDSRVDIVLGAMYRDGAIDPAQLEVARSAALHFAPAALKQER